MLYKWSSLVHNCTFGSDYHLNIGIPSMPVHGMLLYWAFLNTDNCPGFPFFSVSRKSIQESAPVWTSPKSCDSLVLVPEPPPPVPPHKAPPPTAFDPRPRSSMSSGRKCSSREDLTDRATGRKCASREDLSDRVTGRKYASREDLADRFSNAVAVSDRSLHRSVGSELPKIVDHYCQWQQQQQQQQQPPKASQQVTLRFFFLNVASSRVDL